MPKPVGRAGRSQGCSEATDDPGESSVVVHADRAPLIVLMIMGVMGYPKRVSFLSGLPAAKISEVSLILIALGAAVGHVGDDAVGLVTIGVSTYLIIYSHDHVDDVWVLSVLHPGCTPLEQPQGRRQPFVDRVVPGPGAAGVPDSQRRGPGDSTTATRSGTH